MVNDGSVRIQLILDSDGADDVNQSMDSVISRLFSLRGLALAAGAAIGFLSAKVLTGSIRKFAEFEQALVDVEKVTDPQTALMLADAMRELSLEIPIATNELLGLTAVAAQMGIAGEDLENFTETVARLGAATDIAGEEAARGLGRIITQTGVSADKADELGAVINELSNNFNATTRDIVDASTRSAFALRGLGATAQDILALNTVVSIFSESAERGGTRLRRFAQEIQEPKKIQAFAQAVGISSEQLRQLSRDSPVELLIAMSKLFASNADAAGIMADIFSTETVQVFQALGLEADQVVEALELSNEEFKNATSLVEESDRAFDTLNGRFQTTRNLLNAIFVEIGQFLEPQVVSLIGTTNEALGAFQRLNEESNGALGGLILLTGAVVGLGVAVAAFINLFGGFDKVLGGLRKIAANPIIRGLTRLGLALLLLAPLIEENFLGIRDKLADFADLLGEQVDKAVDKLGELRTAFEDLDEATGGKLSFVVKLGAGILGLIQLFRGLRDIIGGVISSQAVRGFATKIIAALGLDKVASALTKLAAKFGITATSIRNAFTLKTVSKVLSRFGRLLGVIGLAVSAFALAYETNFANIRDLTNLTVTNIIDFLDRLGRAIRDAVGAEVVELAMQVQENFKLLREDVNRTVEDWEEDFERLKRIVGGLLTAVSPFSDALGAVLLRLASIFEPVLDFFERQLITAVRFGIDAVSAVLGTFIDFVITGFRVLLAFLRGDFREGFEIGFEFVERVFNGFVQFVTRWGEQSKIEFGLAIDTVKEVARRAFGEIVQVIKDKLADALQGVIDWADSVREKFSNLANELVFGSIVPDMMDAIVKTIEDSADPAGQAAKRVAESIKMPVQDAANSVKSSVQEIRDLEFFERPGELAQRANISEAVQGAIGGFDASGLRDMFRVSAFTGDRGFRGGSRIELTEGGGFLTGQGLSSAEVEAVLGRKLASQSISFSLLPEQRDDFLFFDPNTNLPAQIADKLAQAILAKQAGIDLLELGRSPQRGSQPGSMSIQRVVINAPNAESGGQIAEDFEDRLRSRFPIQP